jgi:hypothetical protein
MGVPKGRLRRSLCSRCAVRCAHVRRADGPLAAGFAGEEEEEEEEEVGVATALGTG